MNGNVTKAGITADLEAMATAGIGGAHVFDVGCGIPSGDVKFNTPAWDEHIRFAAQEAERLGLELTLVNCSGFANAGGPWVAPSNSMFRVTSSEIAVKGGTRPAGPLPRTARDNGFYRDIAVLAFPRPACEDGPGLSVESPTTNVFVVSADCPFALRGVSVEMEFPHWCWHRYLDATLEVSDDGWGWRGAGSVTEQVVYSGRTANGKGNPQLIAFERPVTGRFVRVSCDTSRNYGGSSIPCPIVRLTPETRRSLSQLTRRLLNAREGTAFDPVAPCAADEAVASDRIVDLTDRLRPDGSLDWSAPAGDNWVVQRVGYVSTGVGNHPSTEFGGGLEVDKLDASAVARHFDAYVGKYADLAAVKATLCDSWEVGTQNWTHGFEREFARRNGYSLVPYLVAFSGRIVRSAERTEAALRDFRRTVSDLFVENFAGTLTRRAHERGIRTAIECYGSSSADDTSFAAAVDIPMTEFWTLATDDAVDYPKTNYVRLAKAVASSAHLLGRRYVDAEGFTSSAANGGRWLKDPFGLKAVGDLMYASGVNRMVFHRFAHQPWTEPARLPGMTMGPWGTHFERTETWWPMVGPFLLYQARCQYMLQEGRSVLDALWFAGDDSPNDGIPDTDLGGIGFDTVGRGLLPKLKVRDGRIVAPGGTDYAVLILPTNRWISASSRKAIDRLAAAGARVITEAEEPGIPPDFICSGTPYRVRAFHRRYAEGREAYFVAYPSVNPASVTCSFRVTGMRPSIWDPETGRISAPQRWRPIGERTEVEIEFRPCDALFVVFDSEGTQAGDYADAGRLRPSSMHTVEGPWKVSFPTGWNCPEAVVLSNLVSWTEIPDGEVRYFSGIATYETEVKAWDGGEDGRGRVVLSLGEVKNVAEVTVNGKTYPALWRPPFEVDITDAVADKSRIDLVVRVANLWPNRLIGDEQLMPDCEWSGDSLKAIPDFVRRGEPSPTRRCTFTTWRHWRSDEPLLRSGLIGPMKVLICR